MEIDNYCFACGCENPIGLRLRFEPIQEGVRAYYTPTREFQGYSNMLHGGIITTLMDEAMAHAVIAKGYLAVTARLEVKFKKPVAMAAPLCLRGRVLLEKGKLIQAYGEIEQNGEIKATATADFLIVNTAKEERK
jgi:acyl-coenzyme A thioesterase PaaI-like protein